MRSAGLLRTFVNVPELSAVGSARERAAFVALHVEGRTVREAAETLNVSKSEVANLSNLFQTKVAAKISELRRKRISCSLEYKAAFTAISNRLYEMAEENGRHDYDWDYSNWKPSREDLAECFGLPIPRFDDE